MSHSTKELPFVTSLENTIEQWPTLSAGQKTAVVAANLTSAARPAARLIHELHRDNDVPSGRDLMAGFAIMLSDKADGVIARHFDGKTDLGKELDPFMDKVDFLIWEISQNRRGQLSMAHLVARFGRDAVVTLIRSYVAGSTDGNVEIGAGWQGKASTALRGGSLLATETKAELYIPRPVHQRMATTALMASGAMNVRNLLNAKHEYDLSGPSVKLPATA